jgi:hypothetical protein
MAETRSKKVSRTGKTYTLVLMTPSEFDDFLLTKRHISQVIERFNGYEVLGFTIVSRRAVIVMKDGLVWGVVPYAWVVYLPVDSQGRYDEETFQHEVFYHVDHDIHHPVVPNVR